MRVAAWRLRTVVLGFRWVDIADWPTQARSFWLLCPLPLPYAGVAARLWREIMRAARPAIAPAFRLIARGHRPGRAMWRDFCANPFGPDQDMAVTGIIDVEMGYDGYIRRVGYFLPPRCFRWVG